MTGLKASLRPLLVGALLLALPALGAEPLPFVRAEQVDLLRLLPPPPADSGPDMAEVLAVQRVRTPERTARAVADAQETVFDMYRSVLGERFTPATLPLTTALFARLGETEEVVVGPAKKGFARPRPHLANAEVHPAVKPSNSGSYPSGHATRGTLEGIVLASMLPERRSDIFVRMQDYAESRLIGGVHYRSDLEAGARAGTAIAAVLLDDMQFQTEFAPARQELRAALGYSE